jgi:hypothetical protein
MTVRTVVERGPKGKKSVAFALDWPGWSRGAMTAEFDASGPLEIVEDRVGPGSTDFWGISFAFSGNDTQAMSSEELARELTLMRACWTFFDEVRSRVSAQLQQGPRGGGRDRDQIVRHVVSNEHHWAKRLGVLTPDDTILTDEGLRAHRDAYCTAIRALHAQGKMARTWPVRYLIRHTAYHILDHAWEMEDKDLTARLRARDSSTSCGRARQA